MNQKKITKYRESKEVRAKNWFLTYPKCNASKEDLLLFLKSFEHYSRSVISQENHKDGDLHLHAFVTFRNRVNNTKGHVFDFLGFHGHYEIPKSIPKTIDYIKKDGNYIIDGLFPKHSQVMKENKELLVSDLESEFISGNLSITQYIAWKKGKALYDIAKKEYHETDHVRGIWVHGPPGTGKSTWAFSFAKRYFPNSYFVKLQNKWFDGYKDEKCIILDDFDHQGEHSGHNLKNWLDRLPSVGEVKCSHAVLKHDCFIITSNYTPSEIWPNDDMLQIALKRRCFFHELKVVHSASKLVNNGIFDEKIYVEQILKMKF